MGRNQILVCAINDSLLSLGEPIKQTIVWHLNAQGIYLDERKSVDIRQLYKHLEHIIGDITEVVLAEIYDRLKADVPGASVLGETDGNTTVEMIERLLGLHQGSLAQ